MLEPKTQSQIQEWWNSATQTNPFWMATAGIPVLLILLIVLILPEDNIMDGEYFYSSFTATCAGTATTAAFQCRPSTSFQCITKIISLHLKGPMEVSVRNRWAMGRWQGLRLEPLETLMPKSLMLVGAWLWVPRTNIRRGSPWEGQISFLPLMKAEKK